VEAAGEATTAKHSWNGCSGSSDVTAAEVVCADGFEPHLKWQQMSTAVASRGDCEYLPLAVTMDVCFVPAGAVAARSGAAEAELRSGC
jgi:hypothetical protein